MPIYDFKCESCDHQFEELIPASEQDSMKCPECGEDAKRQFSAQFATEWRPHWLESIPRHLRKKRAPKRRRGEPGYYP